LKKYLQIAVVAGVVLSVIPYKTTTIPAWQIRFTDESGNYVGAWALGGLNAILSNS
jgi:hypothetical protein